MSHEHAQFRNVSVPAEMIDLVHKIIETKPELGYNSVAEVVRVGLRYWAIVTINTLTLIETMLTGADNPTKEILQKILNGNEG